MGQTFPGVQSEVSSYKDQGVDAWGAGGGGGGPGLLTPAGEPQGSHFIKVPVTK